MKHCEQCGSKVENVKFCGSCGHKVGTASNGSSGAKKWIIAFVILLLLVGLGAGGYFGHKAWKEDRQRTADAIAEAQARAEQAENTAREQAQRQAEQQAQLQKQLQEKDWKDSCIRKCDMEAKQWMGGCGYSSSSIGSCQCRCIDFWGKQYFISK